MVLAAMTEDDGGRFGRALFNEVDTKLRATDWDNGAAEAHGLLTGLACRGITNDGLPSRMYLLRAQEESHQLLLSGLFELVLRDLESAQPVFNLLLPTDDAPAAHRVEQIADWCAGFMQGFCHDGEHALLASDEQTREIVGDITTISGMCMEPGEVGEPGDDATADHENSLAQVEEYLRVAIQLIYDQHVGLGPEPDGIH